MLKLSRLNGYSMDISLAVGRLNFNRGNIAANIALKEIVEGFKSIKTGINKIIFVGNGGSNAIATHMAEDYTKCGRMRSICFNDGSLLTCLGNDFSFEQIFEKAIEFHAIQGDIVVAISSSGKSKNILNAVVVAKRIGCKVITLSGFDPENPLSCAGDINIHVPANSFGIVENAHQIILHCILDYITEN